jgi:lipoprotein-anchoring transpeptidase ErfK/SrfK
MIWLAAALAVGLPLAPLQPAAQPEIDLTDIHLAEMKPVPRDHGAVTREVVDFQTNEAAGTIIISNTDRTLHLVLGDGRAARYRISVGRDGFLWTGTVAVGRKTEWPEWRPPSAMRQRNPDLPDMVPSGPYNPLGARAIYLYAGGGDTLYRIHGTNTSETVGGYETSGCFRLSNADVMELYGQVRLGAKVIVK